MTTTTPTSDLAEADAFVARWVADWNAHDADAIAGHYEEGVGYHSPFVAALTGQPHLVGRDAVRSYVAAALERYPALHFDPPELVAVGAGSLAFVPAGTLHNFRNTGSTPLRLYTVYAPPEHAPGTVHETKEEADAAEAEHGH